MRKKTLVTGGALVVLALGAAVALWFAYTNVREQPKEQEIVTHSTTTPSEEPVTDKNFTWSGGAEDPKLIRLPSVGTEAFVQKVGVDQNKQIAVPTNIHLAGWFVNSSQPGQPGLSVIDGHVDGRFTSKGVFGGIDQLKEGDQFEIERGDGRRLTFRTKKVTTLDAKDAANVLFSQDPTVKSQLNLVTCGGAFDEKAQSYEKRVIVAAEYIP